MEIIRWTTTCLLTLIVVFQRSTRATQREISVSRGSFAYIRPSDLGFDFQPMTAGGFYCVISVVNDDPASLRVGRVYPEVFRCDFQALGVRYIHNGNPLLEADRVQLTVRQATHSQTYVDEIVLSVRVTQPVDTVFISSRSTSSFPTSELHVDVAASPLSGLIDSAILRFRYNFTGGAICTLTYSNQQPVQFRSQSRVSGSLVAPDGTTVVDNLSIDCRDFITSGYRYKLRDQWNSTSNTSLIDIDHLPLSVEVEYFVNHTTNDVRQLPDRGILTETLFLPVHISTGVKNKPPKIERPRSWSASKGDPSIVWIDQYSTLILTTDMLSAVDEETPASDLVFSVSKQTTNPVDGYFVDVRSDSWKPLWTFRQSDLVEGRIAYQPVSLEPTSDRILDVDLTVTDGRFASSRPFRFRIGLRRVEPSSPKITQNTGLVLGRGQSRRIGTDQLRIYDASGRADWVQIHVLRGGPRHGTFKVCGRVSDVFNASNLERREVVYEHNGGEDEQDEDDSVLLRVSNFKYSSRTKFQISIISSSWWTGRRQHHLVDGIGTNVATEVRQNGYAQVTTLHLGGGQVGNVLASDTFVYQVVEAPQYGEILMMFRPMTRGRRSSRFTQLDLDRGHIWYHHSVPTSPTHDYFRFVLRSAIDRDRTVDEPETVLRHDIVVRPHDFDEQPLRSHSSVQSLNVSLPASLITIGQDSLLYVDGDNPTDDVLYVVTCQPYFVQTGSTICGDYQHVSYDAGQLVYFDKTVTPVISRSSTSDNVTLGSGSSTAVFPILRTFTQSMLTSELVSYQLPAVTAPCIDRQNPVHVRFIFSVSDLHGNFAVDQFFDIHLIPAVFSSSSSKTSENLTKFATHRLLPAPDGVVNMASVDVNESERVIISLNHLNNKLNVEELSDEAVCDIIKTPLDGVILVDGRTAKSFTLADLRAGLIQYQHTGGETGQLRRTDSATIGVRSAHVDDLNLIDIELVIRPVDNSPPELTVGGLVLIGANQLTVPLTNEAVTAFDVDTDPDQLMFVVVETPAFGRLDVVMNRSTVTQTSDEVGSVVSARRGRSSINRRASGRVTSKRSVTAFSMSELRSGAVRYVRRSNLSSSGSSLRSALFDSFKVYASDGERRSAIGQVEIALQSSTSLFDEFQVEENIDVEEGGDRVFEIHVKNKTKNKLLVLDSTSSDLVVTLVSPPRHGKVLMSIKTGQIVTEVNLDAVSVSDLNNPNLRMIYRHDGRTSNSTDDFSLAVAGGNRQHTLKTVHVDVRPRDRLTPVLMLANKLIVRGRSGRTFITESHLMAKDPDSSDEKIHYVVVLPPAKGRLERWTNSSSVNSTESIEKGESFSQADVNTNTISYVASSEEPQFEDSFAFQLTDGRNPSSFTGTLNIEITANGDIQPSHFTCIPAEDNIRQVTVTDGIESCLTTDVLGPPFTDVHVAIFYRIVGQPRLGQVSLQLNQSTAVQSVDLFTQQDVEAGRVFYSLFEYVQGSDTMEYQLEDANGNVLCALRHLHITIDSQNAHLSSLPTPILDINVPLTVIHGYRATLTTANLHMSVNSLLLASYQLVYTVVEPPKHGQILKTGLVLVFSENGEGIRTFTQSDIDSGLIEYKSDSSDESMMDYFLFSIRIVSNESNSTEISSGQSDEQKPLFFSILIQPVTKIPPKVVRREPPEHLVHLDESSTGSTATSGTRFGFIFTADNLKAVHPLFEARDIVYHLKTRPQNGYLEHLGSGRQIRRKFTQRDVDERRIVYVLNERTRMTNDSFTYRIVDLNRNAVDDQSMQLQWSVVQFSQSQYIVCEDAQQLSVSVRRTGAINQTVTVGVRLKSVTAKEQTDFRNKSVGIVEFPPGTREMTWMVEIVNDGLHEGNDEKFKILLENSTNAILGSIDKIQVHLIDFEDGKCMEYIGMITKTHASHASNRRPSKGSQRQVAFNRQANAFRELNPANEQEETESNEYDLSESDYLDKDNGDTPSGLLSSDLAFYIPPDPGSSSSSNVDSARKNKKTKSSVSSLSTKQTKGLSSDYKLPVPQPCSRETQGLLFFDLESSKMYRCTGQRWEHWGWGLTGATETPPSTRGRLSPEIPRGEVRTARHNVANIDKETCSTNWTLDGNTCYLVIAERMTWNEAERRCQSLGGHVTGIASIHDLKRLSVLAGQRQFWTGMYSEPIDGMKSVTTDARRWVNADGSRAAYFNWRSAEGEFSGCSDCNCVAVVGRRLQYVVRPCGGAHRTRAICSARRQRVVSSRRTRKQSNDGRAFH